MSRGEECEFIDHSISFEKVSCNKTRTSNSSKQHVTSYQHRFGGFFFPSSGSLLLSHMFIFNWLISAVEVSRRTKSTSALFRLKKLVPVIGSIFKYYSNTFSDKIDSFFYHTRAMPFFFSCPWLISFQIQFLIRAVRAPTLEKKKVFIMHIPRCADEGNISDDLQFIVWFEDESPTRKKMMNRRVVGNMNFGKLWIFSFANCRPAVDPEAKLIVKFNNTVHLTPAQQSRQYSTVIAMKHSTPLLHPLIIICR